MELSKEEQIQTALGTLPLWHFNLMMRRGNKEGNPDRRLIDVELRALNLKDAKYKLLKRLKPWSIEWNTVRWWCP